MTFRSEDLFVALEQCPIWLPSPYPEGPAGLVLTFEVGTYGAIRSINGNVRFGVTLWIEGTEGAEEPDWPGEDPQDTLKFGKP